MFTGIVERVGRVAAVGERAGGSRLRIDGAGLAASLEPGASIAVDGACLTVTAIEGAHFTVDVMGPTLERTIAVRYAEGTFVNLERALALGGRIEGHLVQGHVDGVGSLLEVETEGEDRRMDFRIPDVVWAQTILHGSVALNGVSLTVSGLPARGICRIGVIPHTLRHTNLGSLRPGDPVNVEGDLIGKHVGTMLARGANRSRK